MATCPDFISKLLILELPAGHRGAYSDLVLPGVCGSAASITSWSFFFWPSSSDWQPQSLTLIQSHARDLSRGCVLSIHHGVS